MINRAAIQEMDINQLHGVEIAYVQAHIIVNQFHMLIVDIISMHIRRF